MKTTVLLALLVAYVCLASDEDKDEHNREKRQAFGFPFSLTPNQGGGFQGSINNPFGGGGFQVNIPNPFGPRPQSQGSAQQQQGNVQSFNINRPQTFQPGASGGFVPSRNTGGFQPGGSGGFRPGGSGGFQPGGSGGFQPGGGGRPSGGAAINVNIDCSQRANRRHPDCRNQKRPVNCNQRRNRNKPECQGSTSTVSDALAQIPWLNRLTSDGQTLRIPNLPKTPSSAAQSRFFLLGTNQPDVPFQQCVTPNFEPGHCRFLQHCILPDFANNFNVFLRYVCFIDGRYVGVCCPDSRNNAGVTPAPTPKPTPRPTPRPTTPPSEARGCGLIAKRPPTRIVGGKDADPQEWPWIAALMRDGANQYCGGTLITDRHVLTAAHCVDGFSQSTIRVRLGEYTFGVTTDSGHVDFNVADIRMHTGYDRNTYVNDIAILALDRSTSFNADIWPVCLPQGDESYVGETATVIGWGTIYFGGPVAQTLQEVTVPVWTNTECDTAYDQDIIDKQLCAGAREGGKDSCQGDSGGPLLLRQGNENRWAIIGVVSWGIRCAEKDNPGVYTRVTKYITWIRENTF